MPVHKVICAYGIGLVEVPVNVGRGLYAAFDGLHIDDPFPVGGQGKLPDTFFNIAQLRLFPEFPSRMPFPDGCAENLSVLDERDSVPVAAPYRIVYAFRITGQLTAVRTVRIADEKVAAGPVLFYRCISHAVQDMFPVRREPGTGNPPESKHHFRGHPFFRPDRTPAYIVLVGIFLDFHCYGYSCGNHYEDAGIDHETSWR